MKSAVLFATLLLQGAVVFAQAVGPQLTAPAPQTSVADPFPAVSLKNFTADTPAAATVDSFLTQMWGYQPNRSWRVAAIQKTQAPGVSRVVVYVVNKGPNAQPQQVTFYVLPDGKHAIAEGIIPFGAKPYADLRKTMQDRADGPARGARDKSLLIVEFADLQCSSCKQLQPTLDDLVKDFPQARFVFQPLPLDTHAAAFLAASYGVCVARQSNDAFFTYAQAVFETQQTLTPTGTVQTLNDAVAKAGLDPTAISACAATQSAKDAVNASMHLATDAGLDQVPLLVINGRIVPANAPYETLQNLILHQAQLDGVPVSPPQPHMTTLPK